MRNVTCGAYSWWGILSHLTGCEFEKIFFASGILFSGYKLISRKEWHHYKAPNT